MDSLIKLAEKIENKELREKTIAIIKSPKLSNKSMEYKPLALKDAPAGFPGFEHHMVKGGLVKHTEGVTLIAISIAKTIEKQYSPVNMDYLISGCLLHDLMRLYDFEKSGAEYEVTTKLLEHEQLIACELYARGFPEEIISMVMGHLKAEGHGMEGMILHFADTIDSYTDFYFSHQCSDHCSCDSDKCSGGE